MQNIVKEEYNKWMKRNEDKSAEMCKEVLQTLHAKISTNINAGVYAVPGGYEIYNTDRAQIKREYDETSGLGVMVRFNAIFFSGCSQ